MTRWGAMIQQAGAGAPKPVSDGAAYQRAASAKKRAITQAHEWVEIPCGKTMKPVQKVLKALLDHIEELEQKGKK